MPYVPKQYDSAKAWLGKYGSENVPEEMDGMRCAAYDLYDDFYFNRPETFSVTLRGANDTEIYLPSTKKIVDATARFLAVKFDFQLRYNGAVNTEETQPLYTQIENIFKREELRRKFIRVKKSGLTRGDVIWHVIANPAKPPGQRIDVHTVHPGCYFPIEDAEHDNKITGVYLVDLVHDPRDKENDASKQVARRLAYRKRENGVITTETALFETGTWDDRNLKPDEVKIVSWITKETALPPVITALPVYHIPNNEPDGSTFGISQVSGIEYLVNALNQSITYEDLTLILQGLGLYVSTAGPPVDPITKQPTQYKLGPGNVVEIDPGDDFRRVTGVQSLSPYQQHLDYLDRSMVQGVGLPDMAVGSVDVAVAQSGVALALKMGPILAENLDKQVTIGGKWDQIGFDLIHGWLPAFEQLSLEDAMFETTFGDPMPVDRTSVMNEVIQLYAAGLLTIPDARKKLEQIGYEYRDDILNELIMEQALKGAAMMGDLFAGAGQAETAPFEEQGSSVSSSVNGEVFAE